MAEAVEMILMKQWASYMAYAVWVVNADGDLIYFNEKAAPLIGRSYDQTGDINANEIATMFEVTDVDGSPLVRPPILVALVDRVAMTQRIRFRGLDGHWRMIDTTAFPISGQDERHLGAVVLFWEVLPA